MIFAYKRKINAQIAQLVEQRTENPRVGGSNPSLGTIFLLLAAILSFTETLQSLPILALTRARD